MFRLTEDMVINTMMFAIATQEGFFTDTNPAFRNNNPGNIVDSSKGVLRFFPTLNEGWEFLENQVYKNVFTRNLTFLEFFAGQRDKDGKLKPGGYPGYCPAPPTQGVIHKLLIGNKPEKYADWCVSVFRTFMPAHKKDKIHRNLKIRDLCF